MNNETKKELIKNTIPIDIAISKVSDWLETINTDILVDMLNNANTKDYYLAKLKNEMEGK